MRMNEIVRQTPRAVSIVRMSLSSIVLMTALAASASYAQSPAASVPTALAQLVQQAAPKATPATQRPTTPTAKPSPFTYDELGATPTIRKPRAPSQKAASEPTKPADDARAEKASQQPATKAAPSPLPK